MKISHCLLPLAIGLAVVTTFVRPTTGFPKYRMDNGMGCVACHGDFNGPVSPAGRIFPFDSKHLMHRASGEMNTECTMCHYDGDELNPDLNFSDSDGFGGGPGYGCLGCHGRDYGGDVGVTGLGLREHHRTVGVASCGLSSCHTGDQDLEVLPENVSPPYYGSFETNAWDGCNRAPLFGENFTLEMDNVRGLDNDGDNLYDEDDPDCIVADCPWDVDGDGTVAVPDLVAVILDWGDNPDSPADVDGDGVVAVTDLTAVILNWGDCP